jgi:hypothetical protein
MQVQSRWFGWMVFGLLVCASPLAQAQSWKPTLHDADELYDAAEDLHDRAERFHDTRTMQVTCQLEHLTADLYKLLKRNACAADVLPLLNATGATLEEASMLVSLSCDLRDDRKALSELAKAQRYFQATVERIQCAMGHPPVYRAPVLVAPAPVPVPYGYEVHHYHQPAAPRALARVRIAAVN